MINTKQILNDIGEDLIKEIDARLSSKNINDTNQASKSLKSESTEKNLKIKGEHYIGALQNGRKPGKFPWVKGDSKNDNVMLRYAKRNNINFEVDGEKIGFKSTAYLMGKGIAEKGTAIFRDRSKGLQLEEVVEMGIEKIKTQISKNIVVNIKSEIKQLFQGI